jgi:hypothetical protein
LAKAGLQSNDRDHDATPRSALILSPEFHAAPFDLTEVLSPAWLTVALQVRFPGLVVGAIRQVELLASSAQKVRFVVTYDDSAGHDVPQALCAKGYFNVDSAKFGFSGVHEARFYAELAPIVPLCVPTVRYAGIGSHPPHGVVIMDDVVAAGGTFFDQLDVFDIETARRSLTGLAAMHGRFWGDSLADEPYLEAKTTTYAGYICALCHRRPPRVEAAHAYPRRRSLGQPVPRARRSDRIGRLAKLRIRALDD